MENRSPAETAPEEAMMKPAPAEKGAKARAEVPEERRILGGLVFDNGDQVMVGVLPGNSAYSLYRIMGGGIRTLVTKMPHERAIEMVNALFLFHKQKVISVVDPMDLRAKTASG